MAARKTADILRDALRAQGNYSESLEITVITAADAYDVFRKAARELKKLKSLTYEVETREGSTAYKPHPMVAIYNNSQEVLLKYLKALGLTADDTQSTEGNPLAELINAINSADEDD